MDKMTVIAENTGPTTFAAETRGHQVVSDVREEYGGTGSAMTAPEILMAAKANCLGSVIALACRSKGIPYEGVRVEVTAEPIDGGKRLDNFVATVHMPEELDERARRTVQAAAKTCKVGATLEAGAHIETRVA